LHPRENQIFMNRSNREEKHVLSIDPTSRGFGYAYFEGPMNLIDWGTKQIDVAENIRCLFQIRGIIQRYRPDAIVLEDPRGKGSQRCHRICKLIQSIRTLASRYHISTRCFSREQVREVFAEQNVRTKHQIAIAISRRLPELKPQLPPFRKPWMSEDERMAIFDATSFALTYYRHANPGS
jgi:hypothetical protein